jgi:hypothetical protein
MRIEPDKRRLVVMNPQVIHHEESLELRILGQPSHEADQDLGR